MIKLFFISALFLGPVFSGVSRQDWKMRSDKDGIKTFSKKTNDSKINAVKADAEFSVSLSQLAGVIMDVPHYDDWVYKSRGTRLLKQVSPAEIFYYAEVDFPWPATDRDFVSHVTVSQDPKTKIVTVLASNVAGMEPVKKGLIRMDHSEARWTIVPDGKNHLLVSYELLADPAGELPPWLINSFSTSGLTETFKALRKQLLKPELSRLSFIID